MESSSPKQYLLLDGKPVLVHTLLHLQHSSLIDEYLVVAPEKDLSVIRDKMGKPYGLSKLRDVIAGGRERQDSVRNGLAEVGEEWDVVVIHDGVRPFVTEEMLTAVITAALRDGAAIAGVPAKDTVKEVSPAGTISATLDRDRIWLAQTPQAFQRPILQEAFRRADAENYRGTDDASLVERLGVPVTMIFGSYNNLKITTPEDLITAEAFLQWRKGKPDAPPR